jgi:hypothetical protein
MQLDEQNKISLTYVLKKIKSTYVTLYLHMFIFAIHFKFYFHRCDEMNKTRSHLHMF